MDCALLDFGWFCSTDSSDNVYLGGSTMSKSGIASNGLQNVYGGGIFDAYIAKFDRLGALRWSTYYGGSELDYGYSCTTDFSGNVYLTGTTLSFNNIASNGYQNDAAGNSDAFLAKLDGQENNVGIREPADKVFHLYPNPSKEVLHIELEHEDGIEIYSINGQLIDMFPVKKQHQIDVSSYPPGMYLVKTKTAVSKFVKY